MEFYYAVYQKGHELTVAACDEDTLGKIFSCSEKGIEIDVKKAFYAKNKGQIEEILPHLREATILNLVGKEIIKMALEEGLITNECVLVIGDTLHAQRAKM